MALLCVDCRHYTVAVIHAGPFLRPLHKCLRKKSLVTGETESCDCADARDNLGDCGPRGRYFEKKTDAK